MTSIFEVRDLEKSFGGVVAAKNISVTVEAGETVGIIGANGAGKTTFVNMVTGHLPPSAGTMHVPPWQRRGASAAAMLLLMSLLAAEFVRRRKVAKIDPLGVAGSACHLSTKGAPPVPRPVCAAPLTPYHDQMCTPTLCLIFPPCFHGESIAEMQFHCAA